MKKILSLPTILSITFVLLSVSVPNAQTVTMETGLLHNLVHNYEMLL